MDMKTILPHVLLFAGQGNPTIGMGADVWDVNDATRRIWDCASDISGLDIRRLCLKGPMNKLIQTTVQQTAVTAINISLYALLREKSSEISVAGACGHSVGEYSALYAAGVFTLEDVFRIIHFRSMLMHDLSQTNKGSMQAVKGRDYAGLSALFSRHNIEAEISCDNSRQQQVIGGTLAALRDTPQILLNEGLHLTKLGVSGAWHTKLMAEGIQPMRDFLTHIEVRPPQFDVLMNVTGQAESDAQAIKENLSLHLTHTVQWTATMDRFLTPSSVQFIEISSKAYLAHLLKDFTHFTPERALHCTAM